LRRCEIRILNFLKAENFNFSKKRNSLIFLTVFNFPDTSLSFSSFCDNREFWSKHQFLNYRIISADTRLLDVTCYFKYLCKINVVSPIHYYTCVYTHALFTRVYPCRDIRWNEFVSLKAQRFASSSPMRARLLPSRYLLSPGARLTVSFCHWFERIEE